MVRTSSKKTYGKYHVARDPQTLKFMKDAEGGPVKGQRIRGARITEEQAASINSSSMTSGLMYAPEKDAITAPVKPAPTSGADEEPLDRDAIFAKIKALVDVGAIDRMPNSNTGIPKLKVILENAKLS